jgi:hypothetical protein
MLILQILAIPHHATMEGFVRRKRKTNTLAFVKIDTLETTVRVSITVIM